jgi:hypothetical protein
MDWRAKPPIKIAAGAGMGLPKPCKMVSPDKTVRFANCNAPAFAPSKGAVLRLDAPAFLKEGGEWKMLPSMVQVQNTSNTFVDNHYEQLR